MEDIDMNKIFIVRERMLWEGKWYSDNTEVCVSKEKAEIVMRRRFNGGIKHFEYFGEAILDDTLVCDYGSFSTDHDKKYECWIEELDWIEELEVFN